MWIESCPATQFRPFLIDYAFPDRVVGYVAQSWVGNEFAHSTADYRWPKDVLPHKIWFSADAIYYMTQQGEYPDPKRPGWNPGHPIGNLLWHIDFHDDKPDQEYIKATLNGVTYVYELTNDEKCCGVHQMGIWRD